MLVFCSVHTACSTLNRTSAFFIPQVAASTQHSDVTSELFAALEVVVNAHWETVLLNSDIFHMV